MVITNYAREDLAQNSARVIRKKEMVKQNI
jgi:hypothetical protein